MDSLANAVRDEFVEPLTALRQAQGERGGFGLTTSLR